MALSFSGVPTWYSLLSTREGGFSFCRAFLLGSLNEGSCLHTSRPLFACCSQTLRLDVREVGMGDNVREGAGWSCALLPLCCPKDQKFNNFPTSCAAGDGPVVPFRENGVE